MKSDNQELIQEYDGELGDRCSRCLHFDPRTHFCRFNPPVPVVLFDERRNMVSVSSKWPVVAMPELDYCAHFSDVDDQIV